MLEIKSSLLAELPEIVVELQEEDSLESQARYGGSSFPIVQISKTVLHANDIASFVLKVGVESVPTLDISMRDINDQFKDTDCIDETTKIVVWIGSLAAKPSPVKLEFEVIDTQTKSGMILAKAKLRLPTELITIGHDTVETMLSEFAKLSGLGIKLDLPEYEQVQISQNYCQVTLIAFLTKFTKDARLTWFIDGQYNVCIQDIDSVCSKHKPETCDIMFITGEELAEPQPVEMSNEQSNPTQFAFDMWGYDYLNVDNTMPDYENIAYDKSYKPDLVKLQVPELHQNKFQAPLDRSRLYIEVDFNPYLLVGNSMPVLLMTSGFVPKRATQAEYNSGTKKPLAQLKIEDLSGIHLITSIEYRMHGGGLRLWCTLTKSS